MKIALITDGIWPYVMGGMQKHSYYLCKYFAKNKIEVDLVHFNQSNFDIDKLEFFSDEEKKYIHSIVVDFPSSKGFPGHYIYNSYRHSKLIFEKLKDKWSSYDFIYTKGFTGWYLIDQKKKNKISCGNIGVKFHGYEMFQRAPDLKIKLQHLFLLRRPVKHISLNADVVFSYGGKITDLIRSLGVDVKKIIEMPSGIEIENIATDITTTQFPLKFLYLGRYERRKGIEEINEALTKLKTSKNKFEFHFIGNIPDDKKITGNNIIYHGEIRDKTILNKKVRDCDVLFCPSYSEGFPNVILEAMASGLAVAATPVGAVELLVDNKNGWIISLANTNEIIKTIEQITTEKTEMIDQRKKTSLERIKKSFIWDDLIKKLIDKINLYNKTNHL